MSGTAAADLERDGGGFLRGLEREMCSLSVVGILARHRLSENATVGALYPVAGVRPRNAPTMTKGIGAISWSNSVRSAPREYALGVME